MTDTHYTGKPTDLDVQIAAELLESGKPLCRDDYEYTFWAMAGACKLCRRAAAGPDGMCARCSACVNPSGDKSFS